jgi:hypothetical protein
MVLRSPRPRKPNTTQSQRGNDPAEVGGVPYETVLGVEELLARLDAIGSAAQGLAVRLDSIDAAADELVARLSALTAVGATAGATVRQVPPREEREDRRLGEAAVARTLIVALRAAYDARAEAEEAARDVCDQAQTDADRILQDAETKAAAMRAQARVALQAVTVDLARGWIAFGERQLTSLRSGTVQYRDGLRKALSEQFLALDDWLTLQSESDVSTHETLGRGPDLPVRLWPEVTSHGDEPTVDLTFRAAAAREPTNPFFAATVTPAND